MRLHTTRMLPLSDDLPIADIIVDRNEAIHAFLPELDELIDEGLVIIDNVEVLRVQKTTTCAFHEPPSTGHVHRNAQVVVFLTLEYVERPRGKR